MKISEAIKLMNTRSSSSEEYGIEWHSDTDTYVRLGSAVGKTAVTGGINDFDSLFPWNGMKRCVLLDNGTVNYYLDANDSTKKADGTTSDLSGTDGQVMVEISKFYYKCVYPDSNTFQFWISDKPRSGYEVHPAFFRDRNGDGNAEEVDKRYFSAFEGYNNGGKLESRIGVVPKVSQTIGTFRTQAQARGSGWGIQDYNLTYAVQMLYLIEYGHFNSQSKIGNGYSDITNTTLISTGRTLMLGNNSGNESNIGTDGKHAVSYRGIENIWGNIYKITDGIAIGAIGSAYTSNKGFNNSNTGYDVNSTDLTVNISGYVSKLKQDKLLPFFPKVISGTSTTYVCDKSSIYANCILTQGGQWNTGGENGMFKFDFGYTYSNAYNFIGSRLTY